jgi:hypothetical protein
MRGRVPNRDEEPLGVLRRGARALPRLALLLGLAAGCSPATPTLPAQPQLPGGLGGDSRLPGGGQDLGRLGMPGAPGDTGETLTCEDFPSWEDMVDWWIAAGLPPEFDPDGDGIPCEELPSRGAPP